MKQTRSSTDKPAVRPPGPAGVPIVGNALQLAGKDVLQHYLKLWEQYGDIVYLKLGPLHGYTLANPEHVHHVLVKNQKNYIKGLGYDGFRLLVGQGLVTSEGELWQQQRRLMQPSFTPAAATHYADMMGEVIERMLDRWQQAAELHRPLTMDAEMMRLTMSVIGRAMFGIDLSEDSLEVGQAFKTAFAFIPERTINPLTAPLALPLPSHRRFRAAMQTINSFIDQRIREARGADRGSQTLLSLLLHARDEETGQGMSEQQLRDEAITLFFAGFETTARSLTWGWYLLAQHPEVLQGLEAEVDAMLGGRRPAVADLFSLKYTRMVVDEVLRLYPPTALLARQNLADDQIDGYTIPAGSMIILMPYLVHRYPAIWQDPERFDPQRFTPEAIERRPKQAYIPFASGPRVCIGNNFALLEMVLLFAMASARFRLERAAHYPIHIAYLGTTQPSQQLIMNISAR